MLMMASQHDILKENTTISTPELLFDLCLKYIGNHMVWVESLAGIPDIIGERLLTSCVQNGHLVNDNDATQYGIKLFGEAYGRDFMECLKCCSAQLMNEYCESLTIMCMSVTHLDVSGCQLGNNNDFLRAIVNMRDLKVLNLSRNELSDDGFRLLLARYRMYRQGFQVLESCDVSENMVSLKTLNTFLNMPQLRNIHVSVALSLKLKVPKFVQEWTANIEKCRFRIIPVDESEMKPRSVVTKGLGAQIVSVWEKRVGELEAARRLKKEERLQQTQGFYACTVKRSRNQRFKPTINNERFDTYSYTRDILRDTATETVGEGLNREEGNSKRKRDILQGQVGESSTGKKKKEHDLDMDLWKLYQS